MFPPESPLLVKRLKISNTPKFGTSSRIQFQCHFIGWPCAQLHKYPKAWSQVGARSFKTGWFNAYATFHLRLLTTSVNIRNAKYEYILTIGVNTFLRKHVFPKLKPVSHFNAGTHGRITPSDAQVGYGKLAQIGPCWCMDGSHSWWIPLLGFPVLAKFTQAPVM